MGIHDIPQKLARLRQVDPHCLLFGAEGHRYRLNPCLRQVEVQSFEREHGIELPRGYREFITEIGDGGAGPYYGLSSLSGAAIWGPLNQPFPFVEAANPLEDSDDDDEDDELFAECYSGCLLIGDTGCAHWIMLIVTGRQRGEIWFDHNVEDRGFEPSGLDFATWYERWLDELLADQGLAERLERHWLQATCRGFPHQCPKCFGTNVQTSENTGSTATVVVSTWDSASPSYRSVRFTCCDCGYSVDQVT
jgi:hypothetical protein